MRFSPTRLTTPMRSAMTSKSVGSKPSFHRKPNRKVAIRYNKQLHRERNYIERMIGHLKINRAIATRYYQLADGCLGMLYIATARHWIKFIHAA
jgi:hypothetical protein